MNIGIRRKQY